MKNLTLLFLVFTVSLVNAQTGSDQAIQSPKLYLQFDFMKVKAENLLDYLEVEEFWSAIHEQRAKRGEILGWDQWSITPGGQAQGSQFVTVMLFTSLENMLKGIDLNQIRSDAKKAFPKKTTAEIEAMIQKTGRSREINNQVLMERIDNTKDNFDMPVGTVCTMAIMKQLKDGYEKAESEIFKPLHQAAVDAGKKGNWAMARVIFPSGSEQYASHAVFNMFKDAAQFARSMEEGLPELNYTTTQAAMAGIQTRDMKNVFLLKLLRKAR